MAQICDEPEIAPLQFVLQAKEPGPKRAGQNPVPSLVQRAASLETFRYATLLCLLRCRDLRLISVWHPSFLSLLLDALPSHWKNLLFDIEKGACRFAD
ncbi:MAG: GH3 auxin-responsive promoter family protein, partial [Verrucomicrobiota bacterium]